jgi:hypothetical protein
MHTIRHVPASTARACTLVQVLDGLLGFFGGYRKSLVCVTAFRVRLVSVIFESKILG